MSTVMLNKKFFYIFTSLLIISSCGGGGGGGSAPPVPNASITLNISSTEIYLNQQVTVSWSVTNASSCSASGSWDGSKSLSGSEDFSFDQPGSKSFTLTCQNSEGSSSSKTVSTNVLDNLNGIVVGINYLDSANVILDLNSNYIVDDGEPSSISSAGNFILPDDNEDIVSFGGTDTVSGIDFSSVTLSSKAYSSSINQKVVTSITSFDYENTGTISSKDLLNLNNDIDIYI